MVGLAPGATAPAVPTVMKPGMSVSTLVALSTTAATSGRPIAGIAATGTSNVQSGWARVVPPSGLSAATRVSTMRVGEVIGTKRPAVSAGAALPVYVPTTSMIRSPPASEKIVMPPDGSTVTIAWLAATAEEAGRRVEVRCGRLRATLRVHLPVAGSRR